MAQPVIIYLAYHKDEENFANSLRKHLNINLIKLEIVCPDDVPPGERSHQWKRSQLERSEIVIFLASASFINSDESTQIEEFVKNGKLTIPILAGHFNYDLTYLRGIECLPGTGKTLRDIPSSKREAKYVIIARQIYARAQSILDQRDQKQKKILVQPEQTTAPEDHALASTWTLRSEYRKKFFAKKKSLPPSRFLDSLEHELQKIPILRITERERFEWWLLCIDYLDQRYSEENLGKRLRAETEQHFRERQNWNSAEKEPLEPPLFFFPEDPLAEILRIWSSQKLAARWLYLGIGYLGLHVPFRRNSSQTSDLYRCIQNNLSFLSHREQRYVELCRKVHSANCPSLLAVFPRPWNGINNSEVEQAITLLQKLRDDSSIESLKKRQIQKEMSAALLNLLGARALWLGQADEAEQAYTYAKEQAIRERNAMAQWAAIEGLLIVHRWVKDRYVNHKTKTANEMKFIELTNKRDALRKNTTIRYVELFLDSRTQSVQAKQLTQILSQIANNPEQLRLHPALAVSSEIDELEELVLDEEEMAFPLPMIGNAATLVGTLRLISGLEPEDSRLVAAVRLLIRYGAGGIDEKFQFYSPAIYPSRSDFLTVWSAIVKPSRSINESLAKISFLERYSEDLPIEMVEDVRLLCEDILKQIQNSTHRGSVRYLRGSHFGEHAAWDIIKNLLEQCTIIASHCTQGTTGALWILDLLNNPQVAVWSKALTILHISAWTEWWEIGAVQCDLLIAIADKIVERLQSRESKALYTEKNGTLLFVREETIPQGIAKLMHACKKARIPGRRLTALHDILCKLLAALLRRDTVFYYQTFFADVVFSWLNSRGDQKTKFFLHQEIDRCLEYLGRFQTNSLYFDTWAALGGQINRLSKDQIDRLELIIQSHTKLLYAAAANGRYMTPPLLSVAAQMLGSKHQKLHAWARGLINVSAPSRHGLVCLMAAPMSKLGDTAIVVERALFHCLRGLAEKPWPWFGSQGSMPPKKEWRDASENGVQDGLYAVHDALLFRNAPPSGFRILLVSTVAQIYSQVAEVAEAAVNVLALALETVPNAVDIDQSIHALCWALARPDRSLRNAALRAATQHKERLCTCTSWADLSAALERFEPPTTLSSAWALRMGRLAAMNTTRTGHRGP